MAWLGTPSPASKISWHFRANICGVLPARAIDSSTCFCAGLMASGVAGVNMPHYIMIPLYCQ